MKKNISIIILLSFVMSLIPTFSYAEDEKINNYGLKENPVFINSSNKTVTYELEDYPKESSNFEIYEDKNASNNKGIIYKSPVESNNNAQIKGDKVPLRIYIKSDERTKVRIWLRFKVENEYANIAHSKDSENTVYLNLYNTSKILNEYTWYAFAGYDIKPGETISANILLRISSAYLDKIVITSDMLCFPRGMSVPEEEFKLGMDTTDYDNLLYPLPPYTPVKERPRVFCNAKRVEEIKENLKYEENKAVYEKVLQTANTPEDKIDWSYVNTSSAYVNAHAFLYLINKNPYNGKKAISSCIKFLDSFDTGSFDLRERGYAMFVTAKVYDWCYDLLDDETKLKLISQMLFNATYLEIGYPPTKMHGRNNGHESEGDIFRSLLSCGIAIYEDFPELYNVAAGKLFEEQLSTRNYYHKLGYHTQGTDYDESRLAYELYLTVLLNYGVMPGLIDEKQEEHMWDEFYQTRPDGYKIRTGDCWNVPSMKGLPGIPQTLFLFANYYNNPYLKDQFHRCFKGFANTTENLYETEFLLMNNPKLKPRTYKELPLTRYNGDGAGVMTSRTSWNMGLGDKSDAMVVRMNLNTNYGAGHDHLDSGHFDIYYKGNLALDSGMYQSALFYDEEGNPVTNRAFGSLHDYNYHKRTIAHNSMLVYDPDETTKYYPQSVRKSEPAVNDGGQEWKDAQMGSFDKLQSNTKIGEILGVDYGDDMYNPSFSYMKGDIGKAYSDKVKDYKRSFVFFNFFDKTYPGALIVFDKITSKNPSFKKTWLLHTQEEPEFKDNMQIADNKTYGNNGRIVNETLLPKTENANIKKIGGKGHEFDVNGKNFKAVAPKLRNDFGQWRIEISPEKESETDYFLNVLHVSDADDNIKPLDSEIIEEGDFVGVKIKDRIALFSKKDGTYKENIFFEIKEDKNFEILVTDMYEGAWDLYKDGEKIDTLIATKNGKDVNFKGGKGKYLLKKNIRNGSTKERDLNFKNYIKPLNEDYYYVRFNDFYYDIPNVVYEDNKLYFPVSKIVSLSNGSYEDKGGSIVFKAGEKEVLKLNKNDLNFKTKNNELLINIDALKDVYKLKYKVDFNYIYTITGGIPIVNIYNDKKANHAFVKNVSGTKEGIDYSNLPVFSVDGDELTSWSFDNTKVKDGYALYEFDKIYTLSSLDILWSVVRGHNMKVETSKDGVNFETVFNGWTDNNFLQGQYQNIKIKETDAKFVKITGYGNNSKRPQWFNYNEIKFNINK